MMYFRTFCLMAALLLLLIQEKACDAAATAAPQKSVDIPEKGPPAGEAEAVAQQSKTVKKELQDNPPAGPKDSMVVVDKGAPEPAAPPALPAEDKVPELPADAKGPAPGSAQSLPVDDVLVELSHMDSDEDAPGQAVIYIVVGITSTAILLLVMRVYRLRLSRAERKYGVQGDRANQELTPLPMAIEDVNSDEDDHTLFEVNRQNIRIL